MNKLKVEIFVVAGSDEVVENGFCFPQLLRTLCFYNLRLDGERVPIPITLMRLRQLFQPVLNGSVMA